MKEISVTELKRRMDAGDDVQVIDIRERNEYDYCNIGVQNIPMGELMTNLDQVAQDKDVVLHCKTGGRSSSMVQALMARGYNNVINLTGGIYAWSDEIDSSIPKY
ncbi:MAG: rhodanese-like domain-containing protein [Flavobacteriales bacterium]|jgi:adenylyltransferase/sulfurtransferase|nr:rhodanese-like domain-containing protein [Flavobacteriales bacterium]NCG31177.1 rhodanese-like domain-containing protein [Bacteroidota bacterium]MBT3964591.1 rhodanese-like domain-containing protein [Flavobacteriales bacterium]MBT4704074.1 rhodanese-like domain-containing protein [Flavobacteriales bacterium]MBT4930721.1 rhodanese-like domain-containing protein [Flavobacteriales bacterium]